MKLIAQYVDQGITTLADLQASLQLAMQLEFATIPPYLCAQWSIDNDPSGVSGMIETIVVQEMFHFALAGNMLSAIGGVPNIAHTAFVPSYPTHVLPGGIQQKLAVDLQPLSPAQLEVFMQIEYPEFPPVAFALAADDTGPATIGDFYDAIAAGFTAVNPTIDVNANFVTMGAATPITSVADALAAISLIKEEGEGSDGSPDQPASDDAALAHYYRFKSILRGKTLEKTGGTWGFTGAPIQMPSVFNFTQSTASPNPSLAFNKALSGLLTGLQTCWTSGTVPSIDDMIALQSKGTTLVQAGIRPEFAWAS